MPRSHIPPCASRREYEVSRQSLTVSRITCFVGISNGREAGKTTPGQWERGPWRKRPGTTRERRCSSPPPFPRVHMADMARTAHGRGVASMLHMLVCCSARPGVGEAFRGPSFCHSLNVFRERVPSERIRALSAAVRGWARGHGKPPFSCL